MRFPSDLKYTKDHEWAKIEGKTVTVGLTDHAQSALGDLVFVELPKVGRQLKTGETFGVVESIKAVSDLYSPVTGTVTKINQAVIDEPSQLNKDPHNTAWLIQIDLTDVGSTSALMDASTYTKHVEALK